MIHSDHVGSQDHSRESQVPVPNLRIKRLGIVSRDYRGTYGNKFRDFSGSFGSVLKKLDQHGCDAVLFSSFSIVSRPEFSPVESFRTLKNIKAVFLEEFWDYPKRKTNQRLAKGYVVFHCFDGNWRTYSLTQQFGSLTGLRKKVMPEFVRDEMPKRIMERCALLLCGETNGVKYCRDEGIVRDKFGLREAIPMRVNVILNPVHDRMTRFEMKLKRQFLSENGRWVVSVWNKGKEDRSKKVRDEANPAWTVFFDNKEKTRLVKSIPNDVGLEIGVLNCC